MTQLTWSGEIGKRVRAGDRPDQSISNVTRIHEALREAGDRFGLAAESISVGLPSRGGRSSSAARAPQTGEPAPEGRCSR